MKRRRASGRRWEADRPVRLQKYVASCGWCSRRHAELLIQAGLVLVNGAPAELGSSVKTGEDVVTINGDVVEPQPVHVLALHKPSGFITATNDTHERLTVIDLLPRALVHAGVLPVGRLDLDTSGLLVLTNDGDLAHRIAHPSFSCSKTYVAVVEGALEERAAERLSRGVDLDDGKTQPARVRILGHGHGWTRLELVLTEGRKRQVRRMCEAVGHPVRVLVRVGIADVALGELPVGAWRELSPDEIASLRGRRAR